MSERKPSPIELTLARASREANEAQVEAVKEDRDDLKDRYPIEKVIDLCLSGKVQQAEQLVRKYSSAVAKVKIVQAAEDGVILGMSLGLSIVNAEYDSDGWDDGGHIDPKIDGE